MCIKLNRFGRRCICRAGLLFYFQSNDIRSSYGLLSEMYFKRAINGSGLHAVHTFFKLSWFSWWEDVLDLALQVLMLDGCAGEVRADAIEGFSIKQPGEAARWRRISSGIWGKKKNMYKL